MAAIASYDGGAHSNAGTAVSALSEAAFSGSVDNMPADSQAHSYGGNSPIAARSQISTAVSFEGARPAASAAFPAGSGGQESALSAAVEGEGEQSSLLLRPADSRRNQQQRPRGRASSSLLSTAMRSTSSRQPCQAADALHRANSVASQSAWPGDHEATGQAPRTPASVYGQLTLPQPQLSDSPAASTEGNAEGSVGGKAHAHARSGRRNAGERMMPAPQGHMELSLNGPLNSLAGRSYSDAGTDQDISSPKRQRAASSVQAQGNRTAQHRPEGHVPHELSQLATWHRPQSGVNLKHSTVAAAGPVLPEIEHSDARQHHHRVHGLGLQLLNNTAQHGEPAVSSSPPDQSNPMSPPGDALSPAASQYMQPHPWRSSSRQMEPRVPNLMQQQQQAWQAAPAPSVEGRQDLQSANALHGRASGSAQAAPQSRQHTRASASASEPVPAHSPEVDTQMNSAPAADAPRTSHIPDVSQGAGTAQQPSAAHQQAASAISGMGDAREAASGPLDEATSLGGTGNALLGKRSSRQSDAALALLSSLRDGECTGSPMQSDNVSADVASQRQNHSQAVANGSTEHAQTPHAWAQPFPASNGPALLNARRSHQR